MIENQRVEVGHNGRKHQGEYKLSVVLCEQMCAETVFSSVLHTLDVESHLQDGVGASHFQHFV